MKVLFVRFSSLGDIVLTTGIIKKFKSNFNDAKITILTSTGMEVIFENLDFIDEIISFDRNLSFSKYIKFLEKNVNNFDYIIDLHSNLRSKFLKYTSDANYISYKKESLKRRLFVKFRLFKNDLSKLVIEKYYETISNEFKLEKPDIESLRPVLYDYNTITIKNHIVIHPQASKYTKEWPYFKDLITILCDKGFQVTVVGAISDNFDERATNYTGKTKLPELIKTIAAAEILISTDSGPMHIACALNKKTIVIAGSTTKEFGFLPKFKNTKIIEIDDLDCRPCHVHGLEKCPKDHFKCMTQISVPMLLKAISEFSDKTLC